MTDAPADLVEPGPNAPDITGPTGDRPHFPGLEGLRAIAALLVVLTHAGRRAVTPAGPYGGPPRWHGWLREGSGNANVWALLAIGVVGGLVAAGVSYYAVERPLLRLKRLVGDQRDRRRRNRPESMESPAAG